MKKRYRWETVLSRLPKEMPLKIVEIGVWTGTFSEHILTNRPLAKMIQVDRWTVYTALERIAEGNARMCNYEQSRFDRAKEINAERIKVFSDRVQIIEKNSDIAAECVNDKSVDLVFIDAAHSYVGCRADIKAWLPKVKPGGWICGHDYPRRPGVKKSVDELFGDLVETDSDSTWFVRVI